MTRQYNLSDNVRLDRLKKALEDPRPTYEKQKARIISGECK